MYKNYLQHHGVKGMRWGHRKQRYTTGYGVRRRMRSDVNQPKTPEEAKRARRRQIAKRVAIGAAAAAAIGVTAYAVHRAKKNRNKEISAFEKVLKNTSANTKPMGHKEKQTYKTINDNWKTYSDKQKLSIARNSHYSNFNKAKGFQNAAKPKPASNNKTLKQVQVKRNGNMVEYELDDFTQELLKKNAKRLAKAGY